MANMASTAAEAVAATNSISVAISSSVRDQHVFNPGGTFHLWKRAVVHHKAKRKRNRKISSPCPKECVVRPSDKIKAVARQPGFDVAAAIQKAYGVTIEQLKEKLDNPDGGKEVKIIFPFA